VLQRCLVWADVAAIVEACSHWLMTGNVPKLFTNAGPRHNLHRNAKLEFNLNRNRCYNS